MRTSVLLATALLSEVAFSFAFAAFFPIGRALFGAMFASTPCAVELTLGASITGILGLFAGGLPLSFELLCTFSFSQVVVPSDFFHFAYVRLRLFLSSGSVENTVCICFFG